MTTELPAGPDPTAIRLARLGDERAARSIGQLCLLVAVLSVLASAEFALVATGVLPYDPTLHEVLQPQQVRLLAWALAGGMLLHAVAQGVLGLGLVRLQSWARWTVVGLAGLGLISWVGLGLGLCFAHPVAGLMALLVGGGLHALVLYPLVTPGASAVFRAEYRTIVRATPEVRCRMHGWLRLFLLDRDLVGPRQSAPLDIARPPGEP
jgi:hypothetical protein